MRDDVGILNRSPVADNRPHDLPTSAAEKSAAGFTAVNGEVHRTIESRPAENGPRPITNTPVDYGGRGHSHKAAAPGTYDTSNWRPRVSHPIMLNHAGNMSPHRSPSPKRKRSESPVGNPHKREHRDRSNGIDYGSPNRGIDASARGTESPQQAKAPDTRVELGRYEAGRDVRRHTPTRTLHNRSPLPAPRPEIEAALAAQVQELAGQSHSHTQSSHDSSQLHEAYSEQRNSPDDANGGDNADSKKRKRNFSNRTKTGCHTCRQRKKKCDEGKPTCQNCARGNFECGGYGPKPPGGGPKSSTANGRAVVPLQSKQHAPYTPGPYQDARYTDHQHRHLPPTHDRYHSYSGPRPDASEPQRPSIYPGPLPPFDQRPPSVRDSWPATARSHSHWAPAPPEPYLPPPPPPPPLDYPHVPPQPHSLPPPLPPPHMGSDPSQYQVSPALHRPLTASAPSVISSHPSHSSSGGESLFGRAMPGSLTERGKMLRGERYKHFVDPELIADRKSCKAAVEAYNDVCRGSSQVPPIDREKYFPPILNPAARPGHMSGYKGPGREGKCGSHTVVETPFTCEYGYNIHLGKEVAIASNCTFQDANIIYIGDRTIVGPNVKFYCITTSVDAGQRKGTRGDFQAGPIRVEADVVIGADTIVMPFRTIGRGAVVGAGSVVTRDVKPFTVVAGNPAKQIRKRKIEPGPNADRHNDDIQEQNDQMLKKLHRNEVIPWDD